MKNKQISCEQYDYVEIVCMKRYPINLVMKDGKEIKCIAIDTALNNDGSECIEVSSGDETFLVELSEISQLRVCVANPYFNCVSFT